MTLIDEKKSTGNLKQYCKYFSLVAQDSSHEVCYAPVCCCLISKWPYFNLMKDCLSR